MHPAVCVPCRCRECWQQNHYDRPTFKEVVQRLRALLGPGPAASFRLPPSGSTPRARASSGGATVGSPQDHLGF